MLTDLAWKIIGGAVLASILGALALWVIHLQHDSTAYHTLTAKDAACELIAAGKAPISADPGASCSAAVATSVRQAQAFAQCDLDLDAGDTVLRPCGPGVKHLAAELGAADLNAEGVKAQLVALQADQSSAIARAQAQGAADAKRKANADATIKALPRDADGLIDFDAGGLRALAGQAQPAAAAHP